MPTDIITIKTYSNPHFADLAKLSLEQAGIPAFFDNRFIVEANWFLSNAVGEIRLQVPSDRAAEARELLRELDCSAVAKGSDPNACLACGGHFPEDADKCPHCGWSFDEIDA